MGTKGKRVSLIGDANGGSVFTLWEYRIYLSVEIYFQSCFTAEESWGHPKRAVGVSQVGPAKAEAVGLLPTNPQPTPSRPRNWRGGDTPVRSPIPEGPAEIRFNPPQ